MDTTELYILILVKVILTFIQGHMSVRKKNFCANGLTKTLINLYEIIEM